MSQMEALNPLVAAAQEVFGADLLSITLYGSGAEDRLRKTSDLNLIFVLKRFDQSAVERFAPQAAFASATNRVDILWLLESELSAAVESFAQKFSDIRRRHRILFGRDYFAELAPSRAATIFRTRQVLLNAQLRLRDSFVKNVGQPERYGPVVASFAGPLRACAATLRELRREPPLAPKEAFAQFLTSVNTDSSWLAAVSAAREQAPVSAQAAAAALQGLISAAGLLRQELEKL